MTIPTARATRGVAMIDALVALVIFAIGVLGMISLESRTVTLAGGAKYRTDAAMFADQIIAQMWVSLGANGTLPTAQFQHGGSAYTSWANAVTAGLPGATPTIAIDANNDVTITIQWQAPDDAVAHQYVTTTQIQP